MQVVVKASVLMSAELTIEVWPKGVNLLSLCNEQGVVFPNWNLSNGASDTKESWDTEMILGLNLP